MAIVELSADEKEYALHRLCELTLSRPEDDGASQHGLGNDDAGPHDISRDPRAERGEDVREDWVA